MDVDSIIRKVCRVRLSPEQLASRSRKQNLVVARNTIFYLARKHTKLSLQDIGDKFSRRHSTVLKGILRLSASCAAVAPRTSDCRHAGFAGAALGCMGKPGKGKLF